MRLDSPDTIARTLWDAVARGKSVAYPGPAERAFVLAERLFPALIDRAIAAQFAQERHRRRQRPTRPMPFTSPVAVGDSKCLTSGDIPMLPNLSRTLGALACLAVVATAAPAERDESCDRWMRRCTRLPTNGPRSPFA